MPKHDLSEERDLPIEAFMEHVTKSHGHWLWDGPFNEHGTAQFPGHPPFSASARRAGWQLYKGDVPKPLLVVRDPSKCKQPKCINPDHQHQVDRRQFAIETGSVIGTILTRETCVNGHPWTKKTTAYTPEGYRVCKICRSAKSVRYNKTHPHLTTGLAKVPTAILDKLIARLQAERKKRK